MPKPVCVPCQRFFRPERNSFALTEMMPAERGALPGNQEPHKWKPYKVWFGDKWKCHGCGAEIVVGFGRMPVSEHYLPDFESLQISTGATQLLVNDC